MAIRPSDRTISRSEGVFGPLTPSTPQPILRTGESENQTTTTNSAWSSKAFNVLRYPLSNLEKHKTSVIFTALEQRVDANGVPIESSRNTQPTGQSCIFHFPIGGITVSDSMSYGPVDLQVLGNAISNIDVNINNAGEVISKTAKEVAQSISDSLGVFTGQNFENNADIIAKVIQQLNAGSNPIGAGISSKIQRIANPHTRALFKGMGLREFSFEYTLIPESAQEARMIEEIVKFFRINAYPELSGPSAARDLVFKFPTKFDIDYRFEGRRIAHKILPCFLTSVITQFGDSGSGAGSMMRDGKFVSTKITLKFTEEKTLSKKDIIPDSSGVGY